MAQQDVAQLREQEEKENYHEVTAVIFRNQFNNCTVDSGSNRKPHLNPNFKKQMHGEEGS